MKQLFPVISFLFLTSLLFAQEPNEARKDTAPIETKEHFEYREIIVRDKKEQAGVTSIITDREVKNSTKTDLINVINQNVPSFSTGNNRVMGFGVASSGAAEMSIRGIGVSGWGPTTGLPILINGLDTTTSIMGHPVADVFTMKNIDRIEVLHGPQPVLYGSGAMGGVVNVITKRQETDGYATDITGSYGSYNSTDDNVSHRGKTGAFDYGASYNFQRTDGHREQRTPNGTEATSEYANHNGTARFGFELGKNWYAGMNAYLMRLEIHDPGKEGAASNTLEAFDILRDGVSLNVLNSYEKLDGMIHVFYNSGRHDAEQTATGLHSYHQEDEMYGARAVESIRAFRGSTITAGVDARRWGGTAKNPDNTTIPWLLANGNYYVKDKYLTDASVFGMVEQKLFGVLTLSGGARYTDNSEFGGFTSWQAGAIVNPFASTKLHARAAKGFKLPELRQLYLYGPYPVRDPNPDLDAETYLSYEAGIEQTIVESLTFSVTGYRVESDNKIAATGSYPVTAKWINLDEFNYNGLEAVAKYTLMGMLSFSAGFSYIDNEYRGTRLPYVPKHRAIGAASFGKYGLFAGIDGSYVRDVCADAAGAQELSNYFVLNAKLAYTFLERYRAFVNFNNITGREYETFAGYPMPGFNVLGGMGVSL